MPNEWIKCSDKLPPLNERVVLFRAGWAEDRAIGFLYEVTEDYIQWQPVAGFAFPGVTHWMPLPEPPKEN